MDNKYVDLTDLVKLVHNGALSGKYVNYICGIDEDRQYKHQEIVDIDKMIRALPADTCLDGFIFGYTVPQLNKEFDLIKLVDDRCVNIELKSGNVTAEKIKEQLIKNRHFLKLIDCERRFYYTFVSSSGVFYELRGDDIVCVSAAEVASRLSGSVKKVDLDAVFMPKNVLVSPLNDPDKFMLGDYLLTQHQQQIESDIFTDIAESTHRFIGLTGGPGTGKTLLVYDFAKKYGQDKKVLIVHSGMLCHGHEILDQRLPNVKIISAKELRYCEINDVDLVIVDEAHRLYESILEKIVRWVKKSDAVCLFSYDNMQKLSKAESMRKTSETIASLCGEKVYTLTNKIRTNKELALFITCLFDMSKFRSEYSFPNVRLIFEPDNEGAVERAKALSRDDGYTYISYTPSFYDPSLDYQKTELNTHAVIGQEYENVCMILDGNFYYDKNVLMGREHPNPDYIFTKLLYQGLTRVRSKLAIIVTDEALLNKIIRMF